MKRFRLVDPKNSGTFIRYSYEAVYRSVQHRRPNPEMIRRHFPGAHATFYTIGEIPM